MTYFRTPMTTIQKLGTLVGASSHLNLDTFIRLVELSTPSVLSAHAAMALQLDVHCARITWRWMARSATRMSTTLLSFCQTFLLAFLTVASCVHLIQRILNLMAVPPAGVVPAAQLPPAFPTAAPTFCHMTGEGGSFVRSQTSDGNWG